eukprot:SAG11_NODE_1144_length_5695_cov_2.181558_5_plen_300_part_01
MLGQHCPNRSACGSPSLTSHHVLAQTLGFKTAPLLIEFIGTLMLCFIVGTATSSAAGGTDLVPLAIGAMLMSMICVGGSVSGGHFNCAVTFAVLLRTWFGPTHDEFDWRDAIRYVLVQCFGAICGAWMAVGAVGEDGQIGYPAVVATEDGTFEVGRAWLAEVIGTFFLCYVVLNTTSVQQLAGNSFFGMSIGLVVFAMAVMFGDISGGAMNPAIGMMGLVTGGGGGDVLDVWIYWTAPYVGAAAASLAFRLMNYEEFHTHVHGPKMMAHCDIPTSITSGAEVEKEMMFHIHAHVAVLQAL